MKIKTTAIWVFILISSCIYGGQIYIDTIAGIKNLSGSVYYRETRVEVPLTPQFTLGIVNSLDDGLLLTGSLNNWRAGAYLLADFTLIPSVPCAVFAGSSFSSSSLISSSISFDAGLRAKINDFPLIPLVLLMKGEVFSDSVNILGFAGLSFSLDGLVKNLVLDLGYSPSAFFSFTSGDRSYYHGISGRFSVLI